MIDTDKYEGRTPGYWSVTSIRDGSIPWNTADEELIADAPLLLAEVKRLRELKIAEEDELEKLCNRAEYYEGEYNLTRRAKQELLVEVKRLREAIESALAVMVGMKVNRPMQNILEEAIE